MFRLLKNKNNILGMNARNLEYIRQANKKKAISLANDKLKTKQALQAAGLPIANLYGIIHNRKELLTFDWDKLPNSFVLKPNHGLGGGGIIVVFGKKKNNLWIGTNDKLIGLTDIMAQISNILDGNFSFSNIPDIAFFEERLRLHQDFKKISWQGMPDIRILIFNNVPVMAMLRLPTRESEGKANLHQGGIGVGVDLISGITTYATYKDKEIHRHPDTGASLNDFAIPNWEAMLEIAIKAGLAIGLGYSGIDIVVDRDKGPVILEVNAHPGLSIQNANLLPLKERLNRVKGLEITSAYKGLKVAQELFAKKEKLPVAQEERNKKILGFIENVTIVLNNNIKEELRAKIDTGIASTTINYNLAEKLGFQKAITCFEHLISQEKIAAKEIKEIEEKLNKINDPKKTLITNIVGFKKGNNYILRPKVAMSFILKNQKINTEVAIAHNDELSYPLIIGRNDLKQFLVDPTKTLTK